jgi:hypothetical protein
MKFLKPENVRYNLVSRMEEKAGECPYLPNYGSSGGG